MDLFQPSYHRLSITSSYHHWTTFSDTAVKWFRSFHTFWCFWGFQTGWTNWAEKKKVASIETWSLILRIISEFILQLQVSRHQVLWSCSWKKLIERNDKTAYSFIHLMSLRYFLPLFHSCWIDNVLSIHCVPGLVLGIGNTVVNRTNSLSHWGRQTINGRA